jgi:hypothetical protein
MQWLCCRYMTTGKHIGKVLVQIRPEEDSKVVVPVPRLMQAYPRYFCNPSRSYIIAGTEHSYTFLPNSKKVHIFTLTLWPAWCESVCQVQTYRFAVVGYLKVHKYFVFFQCGGKQNHGNLKVSGIAWTQQRSDCSGCNKMMSPYVSTIQYNTIQIMSQLKCIHITSQM